MLQGWTISLTEALGFVTGALCVWLLARQSIWNWPIGIANNLFFLVLFAQSGLYADSGLQVVYLLLAIYGWWSWRCGGSGGTALAVSRTSRRTWLWLIPATLLTSALLSVLLRRLTDSTVPDWDAATTALSLAATYGQTRKLLECWWLWIAADIVYIPLYAYKGLALTAVLYVIFLLLCLQALLAWRRDLAR